MAVNNKMTMFEVLSLCNEIKDWKIWEAKIKKINKNFLYLAKCINDRLMFDLQIHYSQIEDAEDLKKYIAYKNAKSINDLLNQNFYQKEKIRHNLNLNLSPNNGWNEVDLAFDAQKIINFNDCILGLLMDSKDYLFDFENDALVNVCASTHYNLKNQGGVKDFGNAIKSFSQNNVSSTCPEMDWRFNGKMDPEDLEDFEMDEQTFQ